MSSGDASLDSGKIVLVEDDDDVRRSLTLLLRARGFTVEVYRSGVELLSNRRLPDADCYVIDYKMPRIDGLELIAKLRAIGLTIPALLITGFFSNTLKARACEAGYHDVIEKPPLNRALMDAIDRIMAQKS